MRIRSMNPFTESPLRPESVIQPQTAPPAPVQPSSPAADSGIFKLLGKLQTDDYILIGIISVLFFEGCDDYILLAALGYLFVMGIL